MNQFGQTIKIISTESKQFIELTNDALPSGIYFIRVSENGAFVWGEKVEVY
jgi:hypothetical protein